jgi:hypothetical protein
VTRFFTLKEILLEAEYSLFIISMHYIIALSLHANYEVESYMRSAKQLICLDDRDKIEESLMIQAIRVLNAEVKQIEDVGWTAENMLLQQLPAT